MGRQLEETVGELITLIPVYSWGWWDENGRWLTFEEVALFEKPIEVGIEWVWKYNGEACGVVAKSVVQMNPLSGHPLSGKWIAIECSPKVQSEYDFGREPLKLRLSIYDGEPQRSESMWLGHGEPLKKLEGHAYVCLPGWNIQMVNAHLVRTSA